MNEQKDTDVVRELMGLKLWLDAMFKAHDKATELNAHVINARFEATNEWRKQLDVERRNFATVDSLRAVEERLNRHQTWQDTATGALNLLRIAGAAGIIGFLLVLWRMITGKP